MSGSQRSRTDINLTLPLYGAGVVAVMPHDYPMILVDALYGEHAGWWRFGLEVTAQTYFVLRGCLSREGVIEHVAQCAAARAGYLTLLNRQPVRPGFLVSLDKVQLPMVPRVGVSLETQLRIVLDFEGYQVAEAVTRAAGDTVFAGRMKLYARPL